MAKQFKTERAASQQHQICSSLLDLMAAAPYAEITVSRICSHAGIPRRTFYYYFDSKEEVMLFLIQGLIMESELESTILAASSASQLETSLTKFFQYWKSKRSHELQILIRQGLEQMLMTHSLKWISEEAFWSHLIDHYSEEELTVSLLLGISCVMYALFHWCSRDFQQSPESMASCVANILTKPLCPSPMNDTPVW